MVTADVREPDAIPRQTILVWTGSRRTRKCRWCGEPITFCRVVASGKWMPFESDPVAVRRTLDSKKNRAVDHLSVADVHFVACPHAASKRRK